MYKTELMEEILKSAKAQELVQMVSPIYGDAYTVLWLYQAIGVVLDQVTEWVESIEQQVVPQTATWSLPYWEDQYKLYADPTWTYERRRQNILNKCLSRGVMNPYRLANIVSVAAGADARIEELTGKNHFTVYVSAMKNQVDEEYIKKEIDNAKPAHLIYNILYEQYVESSLYLGGTIQTYKDVTLMQY